MPGNIKRIGNSLAVWRMSAYHGGVLKGADPMHTDLILWAKEHNSDDDALAVARFASEPEARAMRALHAASTPDWSFFLTWVEPTDQ